MKPFSFKHSAKKVSAKSTAGKAAKLSLLAAGITIALAAAKAEAATYYVSPSGNNSDGTSWTNAWNELNQIKWSSLKANDTIQLDGGTSQVTYATTLTVPANAPPVGIYQSNQSGHSGTVVLDGSVNKSGLAINMLGTGFIAGNGRFLVSGSQGALQGIVVQNFQSTTAVKIHSSGTTSPVLKGFSFRFDNVGILVSGTATPTISLSIFQDCFHAGVQVAQSSKANLQNDWFYNLSLANPNMLNAGVYGNSGQVANCIFGPQLQYGLIDANETATNTGWTCKNALFIDAQRANVSLSHNTTPDKFTNSTFFSTAKNASSNGHYNLALVVPGVGVGNSVVFGAVIKVPTTDGFIGISGAPNDEYSVTGNTTAIASSQVDPKFKTQAIYGYTGIGTDGTTLANTDFSVAATPSLGSSLTSVTQFLNQNFSY